jgi:putative pre-16S rRNA nuclease
MRWLGIDPGEARVGIAACDPEERVAVALEVVPASAAFPAIRAIAQREEIGGIVVGLPVSIDGVERAQAESARKFGARLATLGLPVEFEDERGSTLQAGEGRPGEARDDIAAAIVLQRFLDRRRELGAST